MKPINVLSLFDGISGARLALERAGVPINRYFASEIDKYPRSVTQHNYPNTVQLGDVREVSYENGILSSTTHEEEIEIDLLIGGSPCQGFSFSGAGLAFDDPRSALYFEFERVLKETSPTYFLLENVRMKKEHEQVITSRLKVEPIMIDSATVSAQSRKRLYWTNIPHVHQPEDKGIILSDIIENGVVDRDKSYCIDKNYYKGGNLEQYFSKSRRQLVFKFSATSGFTSSPAPLDKAATLLESDYKSDSRLNRAQRQNAVIERVKGGSMYYRKLTPVECERLQTFPDDYTLTPHPHFKGQLMSDSRRYAMLGNSFTVDVVAHILRHMKRNATPSP